MNELMVPAWCPVCGLSTTMRSSRSTTSYYDWGCCYTCFIQFVEDREERWHSGWRPSEEDIARYLRPVE